MSREARMVPPDWEHPKNERGHWVPLLGYGFAQMLADWEEGNAQWALGLRKNYGPEGGWQRRERAEALMTYEEWSGERPEQEDYMPEWTEGEATHVAMYETTTEGTPMSPAFATPEELAQWLVDDGANAFAGQTASYEGWLRMAQGGWAPSAVSAPGERLRSGVEALKDHTD